MLALDQSTVATKVSESNVHTAAQGVGVLFGMSTMHADPFNIWSNYKLTPLSWDTPCQDIMLGSKIPDNEGHTTSLSLSGTYLPLNNINTRIQTCTLTHPHRLVVWRCESWNKQHENQWVSNVFKFRHWIRLTYMNHKVVNCDSLDCLPYTFKSPT